MHSLAALLVVVACNAAPGARLAKVVEAPPPAVAPPRPVREVTALPAGGAVGVDGALDEPCWQTGLWVGDFVPIGGEGGRPSAQTHIKVRFDSGSLYLAVEAEEPEGAAQAPPEDRVEVWLDPDGLRRHAFFLSCSPAAAAYAMREVEDAPEDVAVTGAATQQAASSEGTGWAAHPEVAFGRHGGWLTCEMRVPLRDIGVPSAISGSTWGLNVARRRAAPAGVGGLECSSLTGVADGPMALFADLRLGVGPVEVSHVDMGALGLGDNRAQLECRSPRGEVSAVDARLTVDGPEGRTTRQRVDLKGREPQTITLPYRVTGPGDVRLVLELVRSDTGDLVCLETLRRRVDSPVRLHPSADVAYRGGDPWSVEAELLVGDVSLPRVVLCLALVKPSGHTIARQRVKPLRTPIRVEFRFGAVSRPGDYRVVFVVLDGRRRLGEAAVPVRIVHPSKRAPKGGQA